MNRRSPQTPPPAAIRRGSGGRRRRGQILAAALAGVALGVAAGAGGRLAPAQETASARRPPLVVPMTPEQQAVFPFEPPFGTFDAIDLSRRLREQLGVAIGESPPNEIRLIQCRRALDEIVLYATEADERRLALDEYDWTLAGELRAAPGDPARVEVIPPGPLGRVNALAFRSVRGRVLVESLVATDAEGKRANSSPAALYLRADAPRREFFHFYEPVELARFSVELATDEPGGAVVEALAGASRSPEEAKLALIEFKRARQLIDEFRFSEAIQVLSRAEGHLRDFHRRHSRRGAAPTNASPPEPAPPADAPATP